ncbi:1,6-anhydro-N-acetylmuramyl-L-alanine amidase AmpD [Tamilnaduibacter salinus]|nr:1,6-anhydro-N-acetylmuramyl-L-alanine amidase AmpD [Tamilnaduibacter salinus]
MAGLCFNRGMMTPDSPQVECPVARSRLHIDDRGWLHPVRHCPSPNYNARPDPDDISLLVVHNISLPPGRFGGDTIERFFCNRLTRGEDPFLDTILDLTVSAHMLIRRDGEPVQFVGFQDRAWHAGRSWYRGREECNDFGIGIELEGTDEHPYTEAQYRQLAAVTACLVNHYPFMEFQRVTGHSDIAPGRKTDPGPSFNWSWFRRCLNDMSAPEGRE